VASYILRWFARTKMVTHPSANGAGRRVTSFKYPTPLPLQTILPHAAAK